MAAALVFRRDRVAVVKLAASAPRWAGMWQFPAVELTRSEKPSAAAERAAREIAGLQARAEKVVAQVKHTVTRYRITLDAFQCQLSPRSRVTPTEVQELVWRKPAELAAIAMPAAHRRLARVATQLAGSEA